MSADETDGTATQPRLSPGLLVTGLLILGIALWGVLGAPSLVSAGTLMAILAILAAAAAGVVLIVRPGRKRPEPSSPDPST